MGVIGNLADWLSRKGEDECAELCNRNLGTLKTRLVRGFDSLGFNVIAIESHYVGVKCFAASRKYPNLYTTFEISKGYVDSSVKWRFYVNGNKFSDFEISLNNILCMLGILANRVSYWRGPFRRRRECPIFTEDMFWEIAESAMSASGMKLVPYTFRYEDVDGVVGKDLPKDTDWFVGTTERRHYTLEGIDGGLESLQGTKDGFPCIPEPYDDELVRAVAKPHIVKADYVQMRLLDMFRNDKVLEFPDREGIYRKS